MATLHGMLKSVQANWARLVRSAVAACSVLSLVACTSGPVDQGGIPRATTATFGYTDQAANADGQSYGGVAFVQALGETSEGQVAVTAKRVEGAAEELIELVRTGSIEGAWLPARDLERAGVGHLAALSAPFVVTSMGAQAAVIERASDDVLGTLSGTGLTGLALFPGALRRPIASERPLAGDETWRGVRVRALSPVQADAFRAFGATPVTRAAALVDGVPQGLFEAAETDVPSQARELEVAAAPYLTPDVVLWSKMWLLVAGTRWWESLSAGDRAAITRAAESATTKAIEADHDEQRLVSTICEAGGRMRPAGQVAVAELRQRAEAVLERLAADPAEGPVLSAVRGAVVDADPATALEIPGYCTAGVSPVQPIGEVPRSRPAVPPGTYRMHLTAQDITKQLGPAKARDAQVLTIVVTKDGRYTNASVFDNDGSEMVFEAGEIFGDADTVYFVNDLEALREVRDSGRAACVWTEPDLGCITNTEPYAVSWRVTDAGDLIFSDPRGLNPDPLIPLTMTAHPYQRIG